MKHCFLRNVRLQVKPTLYLGRWTDGNSDEWIWFFSRQNGQLYKKLPRRWKVYRRQGRGRRGEFPVFRYSTDAISKPNHAYRCTIFLDNRGRIRLQGVGREGEVTLGSHPPQQTILNNNQVQGEQEDVIQSIRNGTAKAVSDGSYLQRENIGTAGWIIEGENVGNQIRGRHETPGSAGSQCSHRSEMWGVLGLIMSVNSLCQLHGIQHGSILAKCDGEGTINILNNRHAIIKNNRKHYDMIQALTSAIERSPIQWSFEHLRGHQDQYISYSQLDRWAQLNVQADTIAKQEVTRILNQGSREGNSAPIPYNPCRIFWRAGNSLEPISSHLSETLRNRIQSHKITKYWEKNGT
jgi:hypothetical protein